MKDLFCILKNSVLAATMFVIFVAILFLLLVFRPALAQDQISDCEDKGGNWQTYPTAHCAPPDMTNEQIQQAQRYVALKEIEMRLIYAEKAH